MSADYIEQWADEVLRESVLADSADRHNFGMKTAVKAVSSSCPTLSEYNVYLASMLKSFVDVSHFVLLSFLETMHDWVGCLFTAVTAFSCCLMLSGVFKLKEEVDSLLIQVHPWEIDWCIQCIRGS